MACSIREILSAPLLLLFVPVFLLKLLWNLVLGIFQKIYALVVRPDPNIVGDDTSPVPIYGSYTGTIFGYFKYMGASWGGWTSYQQANDACGDQVCALDNGCPTVTVLDRASAEKILAGNTCEEDEHPINLTFDKTLFAGQVPNFTRHGDLAVRSRKFLLRIVPQDPSSPQLAEAVEAMRVHMQGWAMQDVSQQPLGNLINGAILTFSSTMLLGTPIGEQLITKVFPVPASGLDYPRVPNCLLGPVYQSALRGQKEILQRMKASPNWPKIKTAAENAGLDDDSACGNMLVAMTFNAFGLGNSLMNAFYFLPALPRQGQELLDDSELLESMAWELLRLNGPPESCTLKRDTDIPTSKGVMHRVKQGTSCYFHLGQVQRDETVWGSASQLRCDRFKPCPAPTLKDPDGDAQPLPTMGFGCPLGTITDKQQHETSHQCAFIHCAQPFIVRFLKMLVNDFTWQVAGFQPTQGTHGALSFDVSPQVLKKTGNPSEDMTPAVPGGVTKLQCFFIRPGRMSIGGDEVPLSAPLLSGKT